MSSTREQQVFQQQRMNQYRQQRQQQDRLAQQREQLLQQQRRQSQLRFQQRYLERLRQDQINLQNARAYNYAAPSYRYSRGGRYYQTNQYGAEMLRQAVNYGYEEGVVPDKLIGRIAHGSTIRILTPIRMQPRLR